MTVRRPGAAAITAGIALSTVPTVAAIAVRAAADDEIERRVALDDDSIVRLGRADRHLQIEPHQLASAAKADRRLAQPRHAPGLDARARGLGDRLDGRADLVEREPQPQPDQRARLGEARGGRAAASATPASNSSTVRPAPTLARSGPRRLAASTTRVTRTPIDAHAGGGQRERQAIHHQPGIDAGADDGDPGGARPGVDLPRQLRRREIGVGEILAGRDDVDARRAGRLDDRHHLGDAREGQHQRDVGAGQRRRRASSADLDAAAGPTSATSPASRPDEGRIVGAGELERRASADRLQHLAPDRAEADDRDARRPRRDAHGVPAALTRRAPPGPRPAPRGTRRSPTGRATRGGGGSLRDRRAGGRPAGGSCRACSRAGRRPPAGHRRARPRAPQARLGGLEFARDLGADPRRGRSCRRAGARPLPARRPARAGGRARASSVVQPVVVVSTGRAAGRLALVLEPQELPLQLGQPRAAASGRPPPDPWRSCAASSPRRRRSPRALGGGQRVLQLGHQRRLLGDRRLELGELVDVRREARWKSSSARSRASRAAAGSLAGRRRRRGRPVPLASPRPTPGRAPRGQSPGAACPRAPPAAR